MSASCGTPHKAEDATLAINHPSFSAAQEWQNRSFHCGQNTLSVSAGVATSIARRMLLCAGTVPVVPSTRPRYSARIGIRGAIGQRNMKLNPKRLQSPLADWMHPRKTVCTSTAPSCREATKSHGLNDRLGAPFTHRSSVMRQRWIFVELFTQLLAIAYTSRIPHTGKPP